MGDSQKLEAVYLASSTETETNRRFLRSIEGSGRCRGYDLHSSWTMADDWDEACPDQWWRLSWIFVIFWKKKRGTIPGWVLSMMPQLKSCIMHVVREWRVGDFLPQLLDFVERYPLFYGHGKSPLMVALGSTQKQQDFVMPYIHVCAAAPHRMFFVHIPSE